MDYHRVGSNKTELKKKVNNILKQKDNNGKNKF